MNNFKKYILLWISQSISQLGSSMTSFALILWTYEQSNSAMSVSLMTLCNFVPYIVASLFAGAFVDRHSKKAIMLISDSVAALGTVSIMALSLSGGLAVWHIYAVNTLIGFMNAFQQPASAVAVGKLVPKEKLSNVSGMNSFSQNLVSVLSPVIAAALFSVSGIKLVLLIDIFSFLFAFLILLFFIHIPEFETAAEKKPILSEMADGFRFLKREKGLLLIMLTMSVVMFFTMITYENILSPMILSRSGNNNMALGIVNAVIGAGGIVGGIMVSLRKKPADCVKMIYISGALSFLLGDIMLAVGRNIPMWALGGIASSLPIPFITAGQNLIMYRKIPEEMRGRVFAARNAVQYSTVPFGLLLGGFLADCVFEPFMQSDSMLAGALSKLVGSGAGSGMAVMFLCTGISGFIMCCISYRNKDIKALNGDD